MIPTIVHQIWIGDSEQFPEKYHKAMSSWKIHNPDYTFMYWTSQKINLFLQTLEPWIYQKYSKLPKFIHKADFAKFFILYYYGGLYVDLDTICTKSIDEIYYLLLKYDVVLYSNRLSIDIDFLLCRPNNHLFHKVILKLHSLKVKNSSSYEIGRSIIPILNTVHGSNVKVLKEFELFNCSHCNVSKCRGNAYITRFADMSYASSLEKFGRNVFCAFCKLTGKYGVYLIKKLHGVEVDYYYN